ncbi:MAG: thymidine phosphorylase family protein [Pseudomonadales bacterium]|nr:thymidine phosphorylase family protein [Pseudomonadales bacterium]
MVSASHSDDRQEAGDSDSLIACDMGINTLQEPLVYMHRDCHICRAEGFSASARVLLASNERQLIATLNVVENDFLSPGHIGLSRIAWERLGVSEGQRVSVSHAPVVGSLSAVRKKIHGHALSEGEMTAIMQDISEHRYRDIEIASFLSVSAGSRLNLDEIIGLTRAMVACGKRLTWPGKGKIFDKHCIGGLPGNRTTPLVVAIASAAGLVIPKTSSRAITSPAGTADTMETLCNVDLQLTDMQRVVAETGACLVWGGAVSLSPADDLMIRVERALDLDGEGQLIASVLSKKIAAGSTHVIIDIPVGETAKIRTRSDADYLASLFTQVGNACGLQVRCLLTDGSRPVGAGIGPVQEARDLLAVLRTEPEAPRDLRQRALELAANLLDLAENNGLENALVKATAILDSGQAWEQFQHIIAAQGGFKVLPHANYSTIVYATRAGMVQRIDNRRLARLAKLAGAPTDAVAGLRLHVNVDSLVGRGDPLFTLYSDSPGERDYALEFYRDNPDIFVIREN